MPRKNETGFSVHQRKSDGQWCARVRDDHGDWLDRRVPKHLGIPTTIPGSPEYCRAKARAEKWVKANLARLKHGDTSIAKEPASEDHRIKSLIEPYLEIRKTSGVSPATLHQDKTALGAYVKKHLGEYVPAELDTKILLGFVDKLKVGLAPSTVRNAIFTLRVFLDVVKARGLAPLDSNPTRDRDFEKQGFPALPKRRIKLVLPKNSVEALVTCPDVDEAWRVRYLFACTSGLRDGEIAGLTWADLDLNAKVPVFHVTKASRLRGKFKKGEIGPTKNEGSVKENIPLHPDAAKAFRRWKASGWAKYVGWQPRPTDPVFPDRKGKTWRPRSSDRIRADLEKAGQPKDVAGKPLDFHSTRRFFATALARAGVEPEIRKVLMRHSTGDVTEDCYTDREVEQLHEAVCRIKLDLQKADVLVLPLKSAS
ncbi:MAG: tyrosine-type recombinase/integrase [Labilithrix sp.]|nr:tyrosine-type recombinase/integrase [Labilithrix sp.]MBX3214312.1 tyrosine-type recombinase/integrase [Labilithrix sp.]